MSVLLQNKFPRCFYSSASFSTVSRPCQAIIKETLEKQMREMKESGIFKGEKIISSMQHSHIKSTKDSDQSNSYPVINMCANNYLGWCNHPDIIQASIDAVKSRGAGLSSVRFICGTQDIHKQLEKLISKFHSTQDAILYPSCFDANAGIFEALFSDQDAIISDELNHASIIDGIRLSKAERLRYRHLDMDDLEKHLKSVSPIKRFKVIVTDGVFSMDGELAPLDRICDLADKYDALVFIDECHATGFLGKTGRGTPDIFNIMPHRIDFINSTLGKALGGASGGYTASSKTFIEWLRQRSRPYLFSNTLPPAVVGSATKAIQMLLDPSLDSEASKSREILQENTLYVRNRLQDAGFTLKGASSNHPIVPVMIFDAKKSSSLAKALLDNGIYAVAFSYPVVPKDQARIRLQVSAVHSKKDLERATAIIIDQGKKLGII